MPRRIATVFAPQDLGAAGTEVIDIKIKGIISRLSMLWKCTNVTVSVMLDAVTACLSKIELVDGSEVLGSVSGAELQAINFYDRRVMPHHELSLTVGGFFEVGLAFDFGRYLWDMDLAFDPKQFQNPQLKVTWNEDACNTGVVVNSFQVYAHVEDDPGKAPIGMLVNREVKSYAMGASSHEYTDVPIDRAIRKLLIRGHSEDHSPIALFDTLKLSLDNDKVVPLDMKADDFERMLKERYPRILEMYTLDDAVTAKELFSALSANQQISIEYDDVLFVTAQSKFAEAVWTGAKATIAASVDIQALNAHVSGDNPGNSFPIDLGDQYDPNTWLPEDMYGSIELDLLSSSDADSGDTAFIVVQQLRRY